MTSQRVLGVIAGIVLVLSALLTGAAPLAAQDDAQCWEKVKPEYVFTDFREQTLSGTSLVRTIQQAVTSQRRNVCMDAFQIESSVDFDFWLERQCSTPATATEFLPAPINPALPVSKVRTFYNSDASGCTQVWKYTVKGGAPPMKISLRGWRLRYANPGDNINIRSTAAVTATVRAGFRWGEVD